MSKPRQKRRRRIWVPAVVLLLVAAAVGGLYAYQLSNPAPTCKDPLGGAKVLTTQLAPPTVFDGVTEFALPTPIREPNAPTVAPDGSVWFAELSVAGIAHFFPDNRTLVEYAWPYDYPAPPFSDGLCGQKTSTWSVVLWDGKVWASDTSGNQLVAMDPSTGQFSTVKLPSSSSFPYTLTPGPDNTLWLTELFNAKLGVLSQNGTIREYSLPGGSEAEPTQVVFANSTTGFYAMINSTAPQEGGVYSFKVDDFSPKLLGGQRLVDPTSLTVGSGALWVALHGSSSVAAYNLTTGSWSYYPTTPVSWVPTTLPYFVDANASSTWFNEHYGNRMARIDAANDSLTEYSESERPVNGNTIGNAVTFATGGNTAWFTEETGNVIGYVDASYNPGFYTTIAGNETLVVPRGSSATVGLVVHDPTHQGVLSLSFADSEGLSSTPSNLTFGVPSTSISPPVGGESTVPVTVSALEALRPGTYYAILTATDGLTYESSFLKVVVPG